MREVIFVNIGQAGVQIGNAVWELFCTEHSIGPDGMPLHNSDIYGLDSFKTVFHEVPNGRYVPRVISLDLEPTVLDEVRTGNYRKLFHPDQLLSGYEDAANNFARGHYTLGRKLIDQCMNQMRKAAHACSYVQGFIIIDGMAGGTGSGFATLLGEKLSVEFTKRLRSQIAVYPSPKIETSVVSPYNTVMNTHGSMEHIELSIIMDNEAMFDMATDCLLIQRPTFSNLNRLLSQVVSSMTVSLRFENSLNSDLDQLCTNLIPFPRIHFPTSHHAPVHCQNRIEHETIDAVELTRSVFSPSSQFIKVNCGVGKLMACVLQYRGCVNPKSVNEAIFEVKRRNDIHFVDWCPTGFKVGINSFPPTTIPGSSLAQTSISVTMLSNTTAICQMWQKLNSKFDLLFKKRSFVHWFVGEGMEESEFEEARENIDSIIKDYEEMGLTEDEFLDDMGSMIMQDESLKENKALSAEGSGERIQPIGEFEKFESEPSVKGGESVRPIGEFGKLESEHSAKGGESIRPISGFGLPESEHSVKGGESIRPIGEFGKSESDVRERYYPS